MLGAVGIEFIVIVLAMGVLVGLGFGFVVRRSLKRRGL
jgi:hypothetical protein